MSPVRKLMEEKVAPKIGKSLGNILVHARVNALDKKIKEGTSAIVSLGTMLTSNETKAEIL